MDQVVTTTYLSVLVLVGACLGIGIIVGMIVGGDSGDLCLLWKAGNAE